MSLSRWMYFFVLFLFQVANAGPMAPLKILSLNLNSEDVRNDSNSLVRDRRFNAMNEWIQANNPDIVFIQEGWNYHNDPSVGLSLARSTGYDLAYRIEMGIKGYFLDSDIVLTKKSLRMSDEVDLKLPHSAAEIGNGKTWVLEFGAVSYAVGVKLVLPDGQFLYAYSTHLLGSSPSNRADQLRAIDADAQTRAARDGVSWANAHVVIGGDMNSKPEESGPLFMMNAGYEDAFATAHPGDPSCSDCGNPLLPWFNPMTIGSGEVPSQTKGTSQSQRIDYIFSRGPSLKTLSSTLMFSLPLNGVWMSDHYGVEATLGDLSTPLLSNPVYDSQAGKYPDTQILKITTDNFMCPDPWNNDGNPDGANCTVVLPPLVVNGPRGVTIENQSDFYFELQMTGPGNIFASHAAALNPREHAAFSFDIPGEYSFVLHNNVESPNPYRSEIDGSIHVQTTGY